MKLLGEELMAGDWEKRDVMGRGLKNVRLSRRRRRRPWMEGRDLAEYLSGREEERRGRTGRRDGS